MVENKKTKREKDIKSKLMAAISMLLVSSIMMVSTTYAWFTLSTAPEVTGITTAIGANGNLEMALLSHVNTADDTDAATTITNTLAGITSGTGDSMDVKAATLANVTWGNLVDLADSSYALDKIALYPAALNKIAGGENAADKIADSYLQTPEYGSDGRVVALESNALARLYGNAVFGTEGYGVRAVGVSSGMSGREQAYRSALNAANSAATKAGNAASSSMAQGGTSLASIGMKHAKGDDSYTVDDLTKIRTALSTLTNENTGALTYAETAMIQYILAEQLIKATDETYATVLTNFDGITSLSDTKLNGMTTSVQTQVDAVLALKTKVNDAIDDVDDLIEQNGPYTWNDISGFVTLLGDIDTMELCGKELSYWLEKDGDTYKHLNELMGNVSNLVLVLKPGTNGNNGVYIDLADIVGYFEAQVTFQDLQFGGFDLSGLSAKMQVNPSVNPTHLVKAKTVASTGADFSNGESGASSISDFYGYIIDLAFRTNAVDSKLMLQTDAIDRIYADSDVNQNTMGGGSTMNFSLEGVQNFNVTQLANLMSNIRIVFFDPATMSIYGEARLDFNQVTNQDGWQLVLGADGKYEQQITTTTQPEDGGESVTTTKEGYKAIDATGAEVEVQVTSISMAMKMWDYEANPNYQTDANGDPVVDSDGNKIITSYNGGWAAEQDIMTLTQNQAAAVSALVYLDGETITNADASTAGITGTMNMQFSSSATLTPMEYGELRQEQDKVEKFDVKVNNVSIGKVEEGKSYTYTLTDEYANYTVTAVTMGDTDVTDTAWNADTKTLTIEAVTGDIVITAVQSVDEGAALSE